MGVVSPRGMDVAPTVCGSAIKTARILDSEGVTIAGSATCYRYLVERNPLTIWNGPGARFRLVPHVEGPDWHATAAGTPPGASCWVAIPFGDPP